MAGALSRRRGTEVWHRHAFRKGSRVARGRIRHARGGRNPFAGEGSLLRSSRAVAGSRRRGADRSRGARRARPVAARLDLRARAPGVRRALPGGPDPRAALDIAGDRSGRADGSRTTRGDRSGHRSRGAAMNENVIDLHGLSKSYPPREPGGKRTELFRALDLEVARGEFVAVEGQSGTGKSSLLHILGGLDREYPGEVEILGADLFG